MFKSDPLKQEIMEQALYIMETGRLIHERVSQIFAGHAELSKNKQQLYDLSVSQLHAVKMILKYQKVTITKLSKILGVSAPSASSMVNRLVEKGILTRQRSREDRRKVVVKVSEEIAEDIDKIQKKILQSFIDLSEKLGSETTKKWCEVLSCVKDVLEKESIL